MSAVCNCFSYDGTLEGLLCVIVKAINMRVMPMSIKPQFMLRDSIDRDKYMHITSSFSLADKFYRYLGSEASVEVQQMVTDCFLTSLPNMERDLFLLICKALKYGPSVTENYQDDVLKRVHMAIRDLYREAQSSVPELSFTSINNVDVSIINPRNNIIPIVKNIVLKNKAYDDLLLYDKRHRLLLIRKGDQAQVIDTTELGSNISDSSPDVIYQYMWKYFSEKGHVADLDTSRTFKSADALTRIWYIAG